MTERDLLFDCLQRLNRAEVDYMLTGSMASNYWGIPRTTHDLDFVVVLSKEAIAGILREFEDGFFLQAEAVRSATQPPYQFNAIDLRSALKVDFWTLKQVPLEQEMFSRRQRIRLLGEPAWVATAEDVVLHKLYWNTITPSERQLGDAAGVIAVQGSALDQVYLRRWAGEIGVTGTLEDLLSGRIGPKTT